MSHTPNLPSVVAASNMPATVYESSVHPLVYADNSLVQRGDFVLRLVEQAGRIVDAGVARVWDTLYYDNGLPIGTVLVAADAPHNYLPDFESFTLTYGDGTVKYYFRNRDTVDEYATRNLLSPLFRAGNYIKHWHADTARITLKPLIHHQPHPQPADFSRKRFFLETVKKQADEGNALCLFVMALYRRAKRRYADAICYFRAAAEHNCAAAWLELGIEYSSGMLLEHNPFKAAQCFLQAAENGDMLGQYYTAVNMIHGSNGIAQNDAQALYWLCRAAENGSAAACLEAGIYYLNGSFHHLHPKNSPYRLNPITAPRYEAAAAMFAKAAFSEWEGAAVAKFHLAECYRLGRGVRHNDNDAQELYRAAAEEGDWNDEAVQAAAYRCGNVAVLETAAENGQPYAAYLIGKMYWHGERTDRDRNLGRRYLRQALESPHECSAQAGELLHEKDAH